MAIPESLLQTAEIVQAPQWAFEGACEVISGRRDPASVGLVGQAVAPTQRLGYSVTCVVCTACIASLLTDRVSLANGKVRALSSYAMHLYILTKNHMSNFDFCLVDAFCCYPALQIVGIVSLFSSQNEPFLLDTDKCFSHFVFLTTNICFSRSLSLSLSFSHRAWHPP